MIQYVIIGSFTTHSLASSIKLCLQHFKAFKFSAGIWIQKMCPFHTSLTFQLTLSSTQEKINLSTLPLSFFMIWVMLGWAITSEQSKAKASIWPTISGTSWPGTYWTCWGGLTQWESGRQPGSLMNTKFHPPCLNICLYHKLSLTTQIPLFKHSFPLTCSNKFSYKAQFGWGLQWVSLYNPQTLSLIPFQSSGYSKFKNKNVGYVGSQEV